MLHLSRRDLCLFSALLLFCNAALSQETRGGIFGHLSDSSSAAVAGARVTVTNTDTNVATTLLTNDAGYYDAPLLVTGNYRVTVDAPGFKKAEQPPFPLPVGSRLEVNFKLEVGGVSDTVTVLAEAPLINSDTLTSGTVVDSKSVVNLPWPGGNSVVLAMLTVGVQDTDTISDYSVRLHSGGPGLRAIAYGGVGGNEFSVDGTSTNANARANGFNPAPDLVEAVNISTSAFDASQGHGTGITIALQTKAGTNQYHGTLRESHHQYAWNALEFFAKQAYYRSINQARGAGNFALADSIRSKPALSPGRENQYGGSFGGPVWIPKLINGKNKLFFFFGYTGHRVGEYRQAYSAVPTAAMRQGDFSSLLQIQSATGVSQAALYQIYDPFSTTADPARPGHVIRTPFPGNIVPQARIINPTYKFLANYLPLPNVAVPATSEPNQDYNAASSIYTEHYTQLANRFDYNATSNNRFFFRWNWNDWLNHGDSYLSTVTPNFTKGSGQDRHDAGLGFDWVHNFGARMLLDVSVGSNVYKQTNPSPGTAGFLPSSFGLPTYMDSKVAQSAVPADFQVLPTMSFTGWSTFSGGGGSIGRYRVLSSKADLSLMASKHSIKTGIDARGQFFTGITPGAIAGTYAYSSTYTQQTDDTTSAGTGNYGGSWASFMMGLPSSISAVTNTDQAYGNPYFGVYVEDGWRVTNKLTLNFGLRLEYELGPTDRYNRLIGPFDPNATLPITAGAQAAYALNPIPELPAAQFKVLGGATFPGAGGTNRRLWSNSFNWLPRVAAAYQLNSKTVLRGGAGMYYDTLNVQNETLNQLGFSWTTTTTLTNDFGQHWLVGNPSAGVSPMTDPFPIRADGTRFDSAPGSSLGPMAPVGRGYSYVPFDRPHARQYRWRLDLQRQFGSSMVLNVGYAGSYSDHIPISHNLAALPAQYNWFGTIRNDAVAANLNTNVTNPYNIKNFASLQSSNPLLYNYMASNSFFTSTTIRKSALLSPYSQMNGLTATEALGRAKTEQLEVSFQRRFFRGFNANAAYTRMYGYAADYFPNPFDASPAWEPSNTSKPHRLTTSAVAELPFGKGRRWLTKGPASLIAGGFQMSMISEYQPGALITWPSTTYYSGANLTDICSGGPHTIGQWFNTANFQTGSTLVATTGQARVFPNIINGYGGCRGEALKRFNLSAQREFKLWERGTLQLRGDLYNVANHSQFALPNTTTTSAQFGQITGTILGGGGGPTNNRSIFVSGRISF